MRVSKTVWFILGIGIFVIALISLLVGYSRLSGEQGKTEDNLSSAQTLLPQLISQKEDLTSQLTQLEDQLTQVNSSLSWSMARFPEAVESIEYDEELVMMAHDCGLEVFSLTASEPTDLEVEDVIYTITRFEIEVRAAISPPTPLSKEYISQNIANILAFINIIVTDEYFSTANIDLVSIEVPETWEEGVKPSATITLIIYSYKGE